MLVEPGSDSVMARAGVAEPKREGAYLGCRWYGPGASRDPRTKHGLVQTRWFGAKPARAVRREQWSWQQ